MLASKILTLISKNSPDDLKLVLIDNKQVQFGTKFNKDVYGQWVKYATNFIKTDKEW